MDTAAAFDTGEVTLAYAEGPNNGPPLVWLHGLGGSRDGNPLVLPHLRERTHLFRPDLRGHGASGHVRRGYRFVDFARDIGAFIREVVGEPAVVGGQSVGAVTTLTLAGTDPDVVLAAIASEPPSYMNEWMTMTSAKYFAQNRDLASLATRAEIEAALRRATPDAAHGLIAARVKGLDENDPDTWGQWADRTIYDGREADKEIARIECPLLILYGDDSLGSLLHNDDVRRIARLNPTARLVHVEGVGHGLPREGVDQFLAVVLPFLDEIAAGLSR